MGSEPNDPVTTVEAELSAMMVGVAIVLTFASFFFWPMTPLAILAWMGVGGAMMARTLLHHRTRHPRLSQRVKVRR